MLKFHAFGNTRSVGFNRGYTVHQTTKLMTRDEALEIYKVQHERFRQTKELQWKINLASWALIAVAISYSEKLGGLSLRQISFGCIIFWIAQMIFSWRTQRALEADKAVSKHILNQLSFGTDKSQNLSINIEELTKQVKIRSTGIWWLAFQALTTGILLGLLIIVTAQK